MRALFLLPLAALLACASSRTIHFPNTHRSGEDQPLASLMQGWETVYDPSPGSNVEVRDFDFRQAWQSKRRAVPRYPSKASRHGIEGLCKVRFLIDESGNQVSVDILETENCPPVFHENTLKAVRKWRFDPMVWDGKAVRATFVLTLKFKLESRKRSRRMRLN